MRLYYYKNNDRKRMLRLIKEHPDWDWMRWEYEASKNNDSDYYMIAYSKMVNDHGPE